VGVPVNREMINDNGGSLVALLCPYPFPNSIQRNSLGFANYPTALKFDDQFGLGSFWSIDVNLIDDIVFFKYLFSCHVPYAMIQISTKITTINFL
jgi:hypothetical protein